MKLCWRMIPPTLDRVKRLHIWCGLLGAGLLFTAFCMKLLTRWSPMGWSYAYDHFTLPRCGLAVRFGTDPFLSHETYSWFGPVGTWWVSHPFLCVALGAPLSYLAPWIGFWVMTLSYLAIHISSFVLFGASLPQSQSLKQRGTDAFVFLMLGAFFPCYVIYVLGQYHAFVTLAVTLCLLPRPKNVLGFSLSALGKPVLAPAAFVLIAQRRFRDVAIISAICAIAYGGWAFLRYDTASGLSIGQSPSFVNALRTGASLTKLTVRGWNQEMGFAKVLDEFMTANEHYPIRLAVAFLPILTAIVLTARKRYPQALAISVLWYFFLYARGHEYHYSTLVPILAFFYCEKDGRYRNLWFAALVAICALPTTYPIIMALGGYANAVQSSSEVMAREFPFLYWTFLVHRPASLFLLLGTVWWAEFVQGWWMARKQPHSTATSKPLEVAS
jgi:hypothetical protein